MIFRRRETGSEITIFLESASDEQTEGYPDDGRKKRDGGQWRVGRLDKGSTGRKSLGNSALAAAAVAGCRR